ncbi:MAG TPA: transcription antitermination factor NusB [Chloroflexota bacterium]|jgi:N utilization substance protein B|nr:transcription antitermination factor NusB [Chloroflexota bacterium]
MFERAIDEQLEQLRRVFAPGPYLDRRLGRAFAFQALYEMDQARHPPIDVLQRLAEAIGDCPEAAYPSEVLRSATNYARELVTGVLERRSTIDRLIHERAPLWPLAQMSAVDRNVLRLGLYESLYGNATVPLRTAINEAVELAKLFGSETSAKFVNGVLGRAVEANASADAPAADPTSSLRAPGVPATSTGERGLDDGHER